jgi:hypothetical protein
MAVQGFYKGKLDDSWDPGAQRLLDLFLGSENYDNRIDNGGMFDLEVLADLRLRYGSELDRVVASQEESRPGRVQQEFAPGSQSG